MATEWIKMSVRLVLRHRVRLEQYSEQRGVTLNTALNLVLGEGFKALDRQERAEAREG